MNRWVGAGLLLLLSAAVVAGTGRWRTGRLGRQPDGSYIVSSGQHIEGGAIAFAGRPIDLALHPSKEFFAILNKGSVLLAAATGVLPSTEVPLPNNANAGFRGLVWAPNGRRLFASTDRGFVATFRCVDGKLYVDRQIVIAPAGVKDNPVPGGMCIGCDGRRLFVAAANRNAIVEIDLTTDRRVREYPVQLLPFEPRLSEDEKLLIVTNWGGRPPKPGERKAKSQHEWLLVDERGAPASGTVSIIDLATGAARHLEVGIHPTSLAVAGDRAYAANAMSDSITVVNLKSLAVERTLAMTWGEKRVLGSMPNALAVRGDTLYACNGGDNALCEIDLPSGKVRGFRPVGYFPVAVALTVDGNAAYVLNTKGNGSVERTNNGEPGNAHDFQGSISVVPLGSRLAAATAVVARNNHWDQPAVRSPLAVYNGAIKHVVYVIKENRTYDEIYGDMPEGNGSARLCSIGETAMPNHRALARQFTLFDNAYCSGTNSADGHAWCTQCLANDYLEHFYVGYSRTYPYDGDCAMSISNAGTIWHAALAKKLSIRNWGEFCGEALAKTEPEPKDWFEVWEDRKRGGKKFKFSAQSPIESLQPYTSREVYCWPLLQSDQHRVDVFLREYEQFSREDRVPNLMTLSLPCDHTEGDQPKYPTPRAMMADNDLALGRLVEGVSRSPQWKETCIFVIEDDAQAGPDHVDGHRTSFLAISPYTRRRFVDSTLYTQTNMFRSIEMMLGLDPLNKFDAYAYPIENCFTDSADLSPYEHRPNNVPLDEGKPSEKKTTAEDEFWRKKTKELDWSKLDAPDPYWLNRIIWHSLYKNSRPYPARDGEAPRATAVDDD